MRRSAHSSPKWLRNICRYPIVQMYQSMYFRSMPELPEVECVRKGILEACLGHSIQKVWSRDLAHLLDTQSLPLKRMEGQHIHALERKGKYLRWILDDYHFFAHLGMSGVWGYNSARSKHTHLEIRLAQGDLLSYTDPRQFGYLCLQPLRQNSKRWDSLGPDAVSSACSATHLYQASRNCSIAIKVWLMDQTKIAGIGNIYASEALFRAHINPIRSAKSLSSAECRVLVQEIRRVLRASIRNRGTTFSDYRLTNGHGGDFQTFLQVFQKTGKPCPQCGQGILQVTQAGRSTFYCGHCQI